MVQVCSTKGKPPRKARPSATTASNSTKLSKTDTPLSTTEPRLQPGHGCLSREVLKDYSVLLLDERPPRPRALLLADSNSQPEEINLLEYLEAKGFIKPPRRTSGVERRAFPVITSPMKRKLSDSASQSSRCRRPRTQKHVSSDTDEDEDYVSDADDELDGVLDREGCEKQGIEVCKLKEVYYSEAFRMLGQLGCKDLVKAWIKVCHPKKQTTHPYNGGDQKEESMRLYSFEGGLTVPDYWPPFDDWENFNGCRHKEPDHIKKPERLMLLVHLLCCGHERFTLDKMKIATAQIEREIPKNFTKKSVAILKEIYGARKKEIDYEKNEIDGDARVFVTMPKPPTKTQKTQKVEKREKIKKEPLPVEFDNGSGAEGSVADILTHATSEDEDPVAAQMDLESVDDEIETIPSMVSSAPTIEVTQRPQWSGHQPPSNAMPLIPVQRQWTGQASPMYSRRSSALQLHQPTNMQHHGLPHETTHRASSTRTTCPSEGHSSCDPHQIPEVLRSSLPYPGHSHPRMTSTEARRPYATLPGRNGRYQVKVPHRSRRPPTTPHNTPSDMLSPHAPSVPSNPMTFSGSSSGVSGLAPINPWQSTIETSNTRQIACAIGQVYNEGADPNALLTSYPSDITSSFGSDFSDSSFGSGLQMSGLSEPFQPNVTSSYEVVDRDLQEQYSTYVSSIFGTLSVQPGSQGYPSMYPQESTMSAENKFIPTAQGHPYQQQPM